MAHFAKINNGNTVINIVVAEQDFINSGVLGDSFLWIQTSYNTHGGKHYDPVTLEEDDGYPLRKNFAKIDDTYDPTRDAFIPPQPFPSWTLNEDTCQWDSPVPYPTDDKMYTWDETTTNWIEVTE